MVFKRYVQIGRICLVTYGPLLDQLVVIVDVVNQNTALIDSPNGRRQTISFKRVQLTDIVLPLPRGARKKTLRKVWTEGEVEAKFAKTNWGKKVKARATKKSLNDFDRFKVLVNAKKQRTRYRQALKDAQTA
mmetsp:Transcript_930/g.1289  ORF Transcript_930/g.1289 Transcript_930/m.1289 type:complete len:132 (+) Transcript_930:357-752(+)|eukprot:CAMPEP_0201548212 /NCGR_PEP_ID=MMETSP0173_2-20130828/4751_1 /ASSEMBLY_ACC=CAM_ASM_000268 /TAXON_ID=218659 /ORGANISM="Vexillifera sp., Strain DIVA3 564/2" /LENGTH=131 /DNA_ID=CAMNT_0047957523 /DNA_START=122 /DNA_END=517 /DNA_ORIENTATION=+